MRNVFYHGETENTEGHRESWKNMLTQTIVNQLSYSIIGCAIEVHRHLGPGLLESVYHECLAEEFKAKGLKVKSQIAVPIEYKSKHLGTPLKLDLLVNETIIIEIKAVEVVLPVHKAQLISYLKLSSKPKGLLINFHSENIKNNVISLVNEEFAKLPVK